VADCKKERGSNNAPSSHPLKDAVIKLFDGVVLEEARRKASISNGKPSWNSLLNKLKKT
tara:strand:+ start:139 stop:315 length:177 start_codon:yes stop_codon:yes gene_type:complete